MYNTIIARGSSTCAQRSYNHASVAALLTKKEKKLHGILVTVTASCVLSSSTCFTVTFIRFIAFRKNMLKF